jgi:SPP1 family predicted phage head-tail adaptor
MKNNVRIEITKSVTNRVNGKPLVSDENFYSCWAELQQLYGTELYEAINIKLENSMVFKVRYCKLLEQLMNKETYKIIYNSNIYNLYYCDLAKYPKKFILLKCNLVK